MKKRHDEDDRADVEFDVHERIPRRWFLATTAAVGFFLFASYLVTGERNPYCSLNPIAPDLFKINGKLPMCQPGTAN